MTSRRFLQALAASLVLAAPLRAQGFPGTYTVRNAQGGVTTLVLTDAGAGKLGGSFNGNGNSFQVTGVAANDEASGVIAGRGLSLFFQAQVKGATLLLVLAEPTAAGTPNLAAAQQVVMTRSAAGAVTGDADGSSAGGASGRPAGGGAPRGAAARVTGVAGVTGVTGVTGGAGGAASATSGRLLAGVAAAVTPQDKQLAQLFVANAWCAFSYSGSQTYSGSSGTTRTERAVMLADGRVLSNQKSEFAGSGESGSAVVSGGDHVVGYWRLERGVLAYSPDGVQWTAANFKMTYNSNGYPIPVVNGKEYMACR